MYNKLWKRNIHDSCNVKQMHNIQRTYNICTTNYGNEIYLKAQIFVGLEFQCLMELLLLQ